MNHLLFRRLYSTRSRSILHLPKANVYKFGDGDAARPVFRQLEWSILDGENWAVVGASSKSSVVKVSQLLLLRIQQQWGEYLR
jgi:ABC-type molybdenum transport system ATPase subunit/photorepair protein PhrA